MLNIVKKTWMLPLVLILAACSNSSTNSGSPSNNSTPPSSEQQNPSSNAADVSTFQFQDDGTIPNNPKFPVLVYHGVFKGQTENIQPTFRKNNWTNGWVDGIFNYHHFHSNVHEVLGILSGHGKVQIGGEKGTIIDVYEGDVIVLPAGTGHKRIEASNDLSVTGAYPNGASYDLQTKANDTLRDNIKRVGRPDTDPVFGSKGPLLEKWSK